MAKYYLYKPAELPARPNRRQPHLHKIFLHCQKYYASDINISAFITLHKKYKILISLVLVTGLFLSFTPPLNPIAGSWYQQFMPNIGGRQISDIFFLDSLTGWAVTPFTVQNDTTYVLKTTNGGNNWFIQFTGTGQFVGRNRVYFLNANTGFTCGNDHFSGSTKITKTTNGGNNWFSLNDPSTAVFDDMVVLNEDTIWLATSSSIGTGVWRTTNGGINWESQFSAGNDNPEKIYMYNGRIGFISASASRIYKTTNSGLNWNLYPDSGFTDMHFIDSLTGWKARGTIKKTTDGGLNWVMQTMPFGGNITNSTINKFSVLNQDTLWGVGGVTWYGSMNYRGIIYRTTNGGVNWLYQIPDTTVYYYQFYHIQFINKNNGWVYVPGIGALNSVNGFRTTSGGNPVWITGITQTSTEIPKYFVLEQNYPNPFNPKTIISYELRVSSYVKLLVYNIQGKEIIILVNQKQNSGTYQVDFSGNGLSTGVYFYKIIINTDKEVFSETRKMILLK